MPNLSHSKNYRIFTKTESHASLFPHSQSRNLLAFIENTQQNRKRGAYMAIDHDRLFKELITTFFEEFLLLFFPHVHEHIDFQHVSFLSEELFTDVTVGEKYRVDLLVETKLKGRIALLSSISKIKATYSHRFQSGCLFTLAVCLKNTESACCRLRYLVTILSDVNLHRLRSNFLFSMCFIFNFLLLSYANKTGVITFATTTQLPLRC
ncbi:hypothetical protein LR68_00525 [Anoxybacillus sp. BCO1]|nr:hypothetical protein LR68_00525 [Anoxybacillus sp. BCO1]